MTIKYVHHYRPVSMATKKQQNYFWMAMPTLASKGGYATSAFWGRNASTGTRISREDSSTGGRPSRTWPNCVRRTRKWRTLRWRENSRSSTWKDLVVCPEWAWEGAPLCWGYSKFPNIPLVSASVIIITTVGSLVRKDRDSNRYLETWDSVPRWRDSSPSLKTGTDSLFRLFSFFRTSSVYPIQKQSNRCPRLQPLPQIQVDWNMPANYSSMAWSRTKGQRGQKLQPSMVLNWLTSSSMPIGTITTGWSIKWLATTAVFLIYSELLLNSLWGPWLAFRRNFFHQVRAWIRPRLKPYPLSPRLIGQTTILRWLPCPAWIAVR